MSIPETVESYYILSLIDSYQAVSESIESNGKSGQKYYGKMAAMESMGKMVVWRHGVRKAESILSKFNDSKEKNIKFTNTIATGSLLILDTHLTNLIDEIMKFLNMPDADQDKYAATYMKNTKEEMANLKDAVTLYTKMGAQVPAVLTESLQIVLQMTEGKTESDFAEIPATELNKTSNRLIISRREVNHLKDQLQIRFPNIITEIKNGKQDNLPEYNWPIYFLYKFLSDKWVAADE